MAAVTAGLRETKTLPEYTYKSSKGKYLQNFLSVERQASGEYTRYGFAPFCGPTIAQSLTFFNNANGLILPASHLIDSFIASVALNNSPIDVTE